MMHGSSLRTVRFSLYIIDSRVGYSCIQRRATADQFALCQLVLWFYFLVHNANRERHWLNLPSATVVTNHVILVSIVIRNTLEISDALV